MHGCDEQRVSGRVSGSKEALVAQAHENLLPVLHLLARVPRHGILCHWEGVEWT